MGRHEDDKEGDKEGVKEDEEDEYNLRIRRTGCYNQHIALLDCHYENKDFR